MNPWAVIGVVGFMFPSLTLALAALGQFAADRVREHRHRDGWDTYAYALQQAKRRRYRESVGGRR